MNPIEKFSSIIDRYDAIFLDLWGVVHDGTAMYPGAKECLEQLHKLGKPVVLISNAPRRAHKAQAVLDQLGVAQHLYQTIYTSGEVAYQHLFDGRFDLGECYYFIGPERDADVLDGLPKQAASKLEEADFLLNVGFGSEQDEKADVAELLLKAKDLELPMLCLNPDLHVVKITGERFECAGVIAAQYQTFGGVVHYFGKPYPQIYEMAHDATVGLDKRLILAVGDGLDTDIRGAVGFGIDRMLITGGILKGQSNVTFKTENTPTYIAETWAW